MRFGLKIFFITALVVLFNNCGQGIQTSSGGKNDTSSAGISPTPTTSVTPKPSSTPTPSPGNLKAQRISAVQSTFYPRRAVHLIGGIGSGSFTTANEQLIAKYDLAILSVWPQWGNVAGTVNTIKGYNPQILLGNYSMLMEISTANSATNYAEHAEWAEIDNSKLWLLNSSGNHVSEYAGTYEINITSYAPLTSTGQRFSVWLADWLDANKYYSTANFDIWMFDNANAVPRANGGKADFYNNGTDQSCTDPAVQAVYQAGEVAEWNEARVKEPNMLMMGNSDTNLSAAGVKGQLDGAQLECMTGMSWSPQSWSVLMTWYLSEPANLRSPALQEFTACTAATDYKSFRYALGATLMGNGFLAYSASDDYSFAGAAWFDEYNVNLGTASQEAATSTSSAYQAGVQAGNYQNGIWRRDFQNGIALVNSTTGSQTISLGGTFYKVAGNQDSSTNNGQAVTTVTINAGDGLMLCKSACSNYPRKSSR